MRVTRRETIRLGLLGGLSMILTAGAIRYHRDILASVSKRNVAYMTGLDFTAYEPAIKIDGRLIETVMRWRSNTQAKDITKWGTMMMARSITFRPFTGRHAYISEQIADDLTETAELDLERLVIEANKSISKISYALDREIGERQLIVNPRLEEENYIASLWKQARVVASDPAAYFLTKSFDSAMVAHREKRNLAFELDKPLAMSFNEYASHLQNLTASKASYNSDIPLIFGFDIDDATGSQFAKQLKTLFLETADAILVNAKVDWSGLKYPPLEKSLKSIRNVIGSKKFYVRIPISRYDEKSGQLTVLSEETIQSALAHISHYADGHFIHDDFGLFLYRGIFGEDQVPALDGGAIKQMIREWHRSQIEA